MNDFGGHKDKLIVVHGSLSCAVAKLCPYEDWNLYEIKIHLDMEISQWKMNC